MNLLKAIFFVLLALVVSACGVEYTNDSNRLKREEGIPSTSTRICIDGVTYIMLMNAAGAPHGLTVMLDKNSKIIPCEVK